MKGYLTGGLFILRIAVVALRLPFWGLKPNSKPAASPLFFVLIIFAQASLARL